MPRRSRTASPTAANPNLTPLLDIVLQLITFFMMLVHFGTRLEGSFSLGRFHAIAPEQVLNTADQVAHSTSQAVCRTF